MNTDDENYRRELTRAIMKLMNSWGLSARDIHTALGLEIPFRQMERYNTGTAFPDNDDLNERIEHLVGISEGLRTAYPHSPKAGVFWLQKPHIRLGHRAPLVAIVNDGLSGMKMVRAELDCTFGWEQTNLAY
jgi:hypothetical protein